MSESVTLVSEVGVVGGGGGLWMVISPVHSLAFLHNKDIFCYLSLFLVQVIFS